MAGNRPTKVPLGKGWGQCIEEHERPTGRRAYLPVFEPDPEPLYDWQERSGWDDDDNQIPW